MEYKIKKEPVKLQSGETKVKFNIYYYSADSEVSIKHPPEFYAYDLNKPQTEIREGYTKHKDSL